MKKNSIVWRFFDRILDKTGRAHGVVCKLCDTQYKFFGNTTNLRSHLSRKHPIQWELSLNGVLDEETLRKNVIEAEVDETTSQSFSGRKFKGNQFIVEQSETENENQDNEEVETATIHLVEQLHADNESDEEWLEEDVFKKIDAYEPVRKKPKLKTIKREIVTPPKQMIYKSTPKINKPDRVFVSAPKDEYSVFGEYIANKLRKFRTPRTRGNIQQLITTILWQAEYGVYDSADAVKKVLMCSIQGCLDNNDTSLAVQEAQSQTLEDTNITQQTVEQIGENY